MSEKETRKKKIGDQPAWTINEIEIGIKIYFDKYGRYPTTHDFDTVDFLPSSRLIQRKFGGIIKLKETLNLDDIKDHSSGECRSNMAKIMYSEAVEYESAFYKFLISKIPEVRVHEHKILRPGHICCDFFIYTSDTDGLAIDIFYAKDLFSLSRVISIKNKRYVGLNFPVYFVLVGNDGIKQKDINSLVSNRKIPLEKNIKIVTEINFKDFVIKSLNS